ncbi:MAG: ATP-dependent helicase [Deltaproteobacteria bacterium]|nr:ATP-dependent helicase [Deltaproteobacteria bacterium]
MATKIDYEKVLNPAQLEAVKTIDGPILVIAGAGSGKTRTLVYRVARLVEMGVDPESILLLTFTRKAAQEMLERAAGLADARCRFVSGGTFHSLALRVLRGHAEVLGMSNAFTILDRSDMEEVISSLVPELLIPKGTPRFPKRGTLANMLSKAANLQQPLGEFILEEYGQFLEFISYIEMLGSLYGKYKKMNELMDYDDLILNFRKLLEVSEEVRKDLGRQYSYVMVDEYQDTNAIQADIVKWLAQGHQNVMVVGDDSQSIYSFRGADFRNMFDFQAQFPKAKQIKLEENYRSTQPILALTNSLMAQASVKYTKCLFTQREEGDVPRVVNTRTEPEQAMFVCRSIQEQLQQGRSIHDCAVLFRAGYHSFELEAELTRQGIRYVKYGGFKFLESAHIKDFLAHLRVMINGDEAVSWIRILRLIRNVGQAKSQALIKWMKANQIAPGQIGQWPGMGNKDNGLTPLAGLLARLSKKSIRPEEGVEQVMEYYVPILKAKFDNYPKRQKELEQLIPMASRYKTLRSFLDDLVLEPPTSPADMGPGQKAETLTLSTVHSAKGLEWPVVFIIWVMEGRFPSPRAYGNPLDLEEERRLMYVAATRAKDQLILCYPGEESPPSWSSYGGIEAGYRSGLSSFIADLPQDVVSHESMGTPKRSSPGKWSHYDSDMSEWDQGQTSGISRGDRVSHPAFGQGVVSRFMGEDKVEVLFRDAGRRLLHLEYTTLEKV